MLREINKTICSIWKLVSLPRPSPEYSCGKSNQLYPIKAVSFVSIVLYLKPNPFE